ncbi:MAG: IDEAL domain-containing protein [Firmicutes bacterium]|nr:IDEAL domain-containing protein [Bacillota bacterium]
MKPMVSPLAKRHFINWFLDAWEFRSEAPATILSALLKQDSILEQIKIIENGSFLRPLLVISSLGTGMPPSLLLTYETMLTKTEAILDYLSAFKNGHLFLTLYFPNRSQCLSFVDVLEEIPLPLEVEKIRSLQIDLELQLLKIEGENENKRNQLLAEIDQALAKGNRGEFHRLVKLLKEY